MAPSRLITVGHSNRSLEELVARLGSAGVQAVADVRSSPFSRYSPQFNRDRLAGALKAAGIEYVWLGEQLGGRPPEDRLYDASGRVDYAALAEHPRFLAGLARLRAGMAKYRLAVLCSEEDPVRCHRRSLIGYLLSNEGVLLEHLRADGQLEEEIGVGLPPGPWRSLRPVRPGVAQGREA